MAFLFCDSFDHYVAGVTSTSDIMKKWQAYYPNLGTNSISGFTAMGQDLSAPGGGNYLQFVTNTGSFTPYLFRPLPSNYATGIAGCWYYQATDTIPTGNQPITFWDLSSTGVPTEQVSVRFTTSNRLILSRNGTTLATSANFFPPYQWMFIELKATIHNTAGNYEVRVNGSSVGWVPAQGGTANTRASSNNSFNALSIGGYANTSQYRIKGVYVCDTSGSVANDFLGPCKVTTVHPMAAGASAAWIPQAGSNLGTINEKYGDSDTSFNASSTANDIDTFDYEDIPTAGSIYGVQHCIYFRQDTGVKRQLAPITRVSNTNYAGTTTDAASSYYYLVDPQTLNPATSAQWTVSDMNAAEFGYKLVT